MTESSSVASPIVQARHTPRHLALVAAGVSLLASSVAAATVLETLLEFGSKDFLAALFWSTPLALSISVSFWLTLQRLPNDSPARQFTMVAPVSALLAIAWTFVVALFLRGMVDGSLGVLSAWITAGLTIGIRVATTGERRVWTAPVLIATVFGAALIGLGAFTNGR